MKQRKNNCIVWSLVLALLCLLCACRQQAHDTQSASGASGASGVPGESAPQQTQTEQTASAAGSGRALTPLSQGTAEGCYTISQNGEHQLLCYVDYALAQQIPLCSQPSCAHDSDTCAAFVQAGKYISALQTDGTTLFFVQNDGETSASEIWAASASGDERRILVGSVSGKYSYSPVAEDGVFLYYLYEAYEMAADGSGSTSPEYRLCLARVPLAGGESETLSSFERSCDGRGYTYLGVGGREVAVWQYDWGKSMEIVIPEDTPPEEMDAVIEAQEEQMQRMTCSHSVMLIDVDTRAQRQLAEWTSSLDSGGRACLWEDGRLYWCMDKACGPVHWLDVNGQSGELAALPIASDDENATYTLACIVQDKLLVDCYSPKADSVSRCAIDLQDASQDGSSANSAMALPLQYIHAVSERPVIVCGQGETGLLVLYEEIFRSWNKNNFDEDSIVRTESSITYSYGMISYEDYFAGRPNYRPVDMPYGFRYW